MTHIPMNIEAEKATLGSMLIDPDAIIRVRGILEPADFFGVQNQSIAQALYNLPGSGVDLVTVSAELDRLGAKVPSAALTELVGETPTSIHAEHYAKIVREASILRDVIQVCTDGTQLAYAPGEQSSDDVLSRLEKSIFDIRARRSTKQSASAKQAASAVMDELEQQLLNPNYVPGIKTGIGNLDKILEYLEHHRFMIIAGRPKCGKSATMTLMTYAMGVRGDPVVHFSLEQTANEVIKRMVGIRLGVDTQTTFKRFKHLNSQQQAEVMKALGEIADLPIYIQSGTFNVFQLRSEFMRVNAQSWLEHGKGLVCMFVDHIHKMLVTPGDERHNVTTQIGHISGHLKAMAMPDSLAVPVIAGAQLNREVEKRTGGRPQLADLRESGTLEQDADIVAFVYPPCSYMTPAEQKKAKAKMKPGFEPYQLLVEKHRDGPEGIAYLAWKRQTGQMMSLTYETPD